MNLGVERLTDAIERSWGSDTSYFRELWTPDNPARGQCVASSLVIRAHLGGELVYRATHLNGIRERHYLNLLPGESELDVTRVQYPDDQVFLTLPNRLKGHESLADKLMSGPLNMRRFTILNNRVLAVLAQEQS